VVHEVAAAGFNDPADYEAARPSYPPEAVAWLVERLGFAPGRVVCDLAAGTGKLTRLLTPHADVIACEPVRGMRATFRTVLPGVPLLAGTAEQLPFAGESLDAITVAQAWHWFDDERAGAEMRRVLRPGGGLGLVWNARDRSVEWVDAIWTIMDRVEKHAPWRRHEEWRESSHAIPGFAPPELAEFHHSQSLTPEAVVQRVASVSHVAVLPADARSAVLDEVGMLLATHPDTRGAETVALAYRVDCIAMKRI
jgi:SAM-dependent methyltransferase